MATTEKNKYIEAVGRRKTSVARVRLAKGAKGGIVVNGKDYGEYFPTKELQKLVKESLVATAMDGAVHLTVKVTGGGIHSQAEAIRLGIARALSLFKVELRTPLKKAKLLSRDPRAKERRKFGLKKARKSPQWSKR